MNRKTSGGTPMRKMKLRLLGGTMLLAFAASEPAAHAQRFEFDYTGSLVTFTAPINGIYQIVAFGAQGGFGGNGAEIGGNFSLTAGEVLQIAVGGAGLGQHRQTPPLLGFGGGGGGS